MGISVGWIFLLSAAADNTMEITTVCRYETIVTGLLKNGHKNGVLKYCCYAIMMKAYVGNCKCYVWLLHTRSNISALEKLQCH